MWKKARLDSLEVDIVAAYQDVQVTWHSSSVGFKLTQLMWLGSGADLVRLVPPPNEKKMLAKKQNKKSLLLSTTPHLGM